MIDLRDRGVDASDVIRALDLRPHPEGGHYRETWRDTPTDGSRGAATAIQFLLAAGERSHWHKVDAAELWIWQAGAPLMLSVGTRPALRLGPDLAAQDVLQGVVPAQEWQAAASLGPWTLCSCIVAPAFDFAGFVLAPAGWTPGAG
jgi:predicted cupin superfamily sugar epimerase